MDYKSLIQVYLVLDPTTITLGTILTIVFCVCLYFNKSRQERQSFLKYTLPDLEFDVINAKIPFDKHATTILLTGGNGFLGPYIIRMLLDEKSYNVIVFDINYPKQREDRVTYVRGNLLNYTHLLKTVEMHTSRGFNIDCVIHSASLIPFLGVPKKAICMVNIQGTQNIIQLCQQKHIKSLIYTGSALSLLVKHDRQAFDLNESETKYPLIDQHLDIYTMTKAAAERLVLAANSPSVLATCSLRPAAIFGRGDKVMSDKYVRGEDAVIVGTGKFVFDYVPAECVAHAHILAVKAITGEKRSLVNGQAYFIGNGERHEVRWFNGHGSFGSSKHVSHWEQPHPWHLPLWFIHSLCYVNDSFYALSGITLMNPSITYTLVDYTQRSYSFSIDKAKRDLEYVPLMTVEEKIAQLVKESRSTLATTSKH